MFGIIFRIVPIIVPLPPIITTQPMKQKAKKTIALTARSNDSLFSFLVVFKMYLMKHTSVNKPMIITNQFVCGKPMAGNPIRASGGWKLTKNNKYTIDFVLNSKAVKIQTSTAQKNIAGIQTNNAKRKMTVHIAILITCAFTVVDLSAWNSLMNGCLIGCSLPYKNVNIFLKNSLHVDAMDFMLTLKAINPQVSNEKIIIGSHQGITPNHHSIAETNKRTASTANLTAIPSVDADLSPDQTFLKNIICKPPQKIQ